MSASVADQPLQHPGQQQDEHDEAQHARDDVGRLGPDAGDEAQGQHDDEQQQDLPEQRHADGLHQILADAQPD